MRCPIDGAPLTIAERQGIEIDFCPTCRGVWLDRGELDKIIERDQAQYGPRAAPPQQAHQPHQPQHHAPQGYAPRYDDDDRYKYRRKKSLLAELFD